MSDETLSVIVDGAPVDLFMSYGLLTELARTVSSIDAIASLDLDNDTRDAFLGSVLADRTKSGKVKTKRALDELDISLEDVERTLNWGKEHLLGFFLRRVENAQGHAAKINAVLEPFSSAGIQA
jgi:hypothetical protein